MRTLKPTYLGKEYSLGDYENMILEELGLNHPIYKKEHFIQPMTYLELCTNLQFPMGQDKEKIVRDWLEKTLLQPGWSDTPQEAAEFITTLERRCADLYGKKRPERLYTFIECIDAFSDFFNKTSWTFR